MTTTKKLPSFLAFATALILYSGSSFAQLTGFGTMVDLSERTGRMHIRTGETLNSGAINKPYISEDYFPGKITLLNGSEIDGFIRYHVMDEMLEVMGSDKTYSWNTVEKFEWDNKNSGEREVWQNVKKIWPAFEYGGFAQLINDKTVAKYFMDYVAPTRDPAMDVGDPNAYNVVSLYHYAILDNELVELPKGKSEFFKVFGDWEKVMKKHAQKEKLKHDTSKDVGELISVYYRTKK
jgi:hypothetical protein